MMYASKAPRDLNHDLLPWIEPAQGWRAPEQMLNWLRYDPRPEFYHVQNNEPNPVLVDIRNAHIGERAHLYVDIEIILLPCHKSTAGVTDRHIEHARRVLTRLARLKASR